MNPTGTDETETGRRRSIDRWIIVGVIVGPILLAAGAYLRQPGFMLPWRTIWMWAVAWCGLIAMEALTIWTAWRSPVLGGNVVRALLIIAVTLGAVIFLDWFPFRSRWFSTLPVGLAIFTLLFQRPVPFLLSALTLVLARRALGIRLIRARDEPGDKPSRISIRELMIWTWVIAAFFSLVYHLSGYVESFEYSVKNGLPGWYTFYFLVHDLPAWLLLVVSLGFLHATGRWKWLPAVIAVYAALAIGKSWIDVTIYETYFGAVGMQLLNGPAILGIVMSAGPTLIATWLLRLMGFRFIRVTCSQPAI